MADSAILKTTTYLEQLAKERSNIAHFPGSILQGLQVIHVGKGIVRCKLIVAHRVLKEDGTFHSGAIAMLMELLGATAVYSAGGSHASVDLNYSLYSTAKFQEEVKIESRVVWKKEDLNSAIIEIRRQHDEELIASGRLWTRILMTPFNINVNDLNQREDGAWDAGAIAVVMDVISSASMYLLSGTFHVTLSLNSSFYSPAKIHETIEIEGRLTGTEGNIKAVMVEIIREEYREVLARGSFWMAPLALGFKDLPPPLPKSRL